MRLLFLFSFLLSISLAQDIDALVKYALKKHPSLDSINQRILAMDTRIKMSQNFSDPDVSLSINDIQFSNPLSRDLEPMQFEAINIKQKFPWFGKLEAKEAFASSQQQEILDSYESAKVTLAKEIRLSAYTIIEIKARLDILKSYKALAKQNIALYTAYASTENKSHGSSVTASLLFATLKIREAKYNAILQAQHSKLKYLVQKKVSHITNTLTIKKPSSLRSYIQKIKNNPQYKQKISQKNTAQKNQTLKDLDQSPDPYVKMGYFHRDAYNDYASISVGVSLPIYDTQAQNLELAKLAVLEANSQKVDFDYLLRNKIETMHIKLNEAYKIYLIIQNESLPQLEHLFELSQSSIQNGENLFAYTRLLEQKLALEEEHIAIKATYLRIEAELNALIGEI